MEKCVFHESSLCAKEVGDCCHRAPNMTWVCTHSSEYQCHLWNLNTKARATLAKAFQHFSWNNCNGLSKTTSCHFDFPYIKPLPKDSWKFHFLSGSCFCVHVGNKAWQVLDPSDAFICNTTHRLLSSCCSQTPTNTHCPSDLCSLAILCTASKFPTNLFNMLLILINSRGKGLIDVHLTCMQLKCICFTAADYKTI